MKRNSKIRTFAGFMAVALMLSTFANDYNTIAAHAENEQPPIQEAVSVSASTEEASVETSSASASTEEAAVEAASVAATEAPASAATTEAAIAATSEEAAASASSTAAVPVAQTYTITYKVNDETFGTLSTKEEQYDPSNPNISGADATAADGYRFVNWTTDDGNGGQKEVGTDSHFKPENVTGDITFTANFEAVAATTEEAPVTKTVNITYAAGEGGTVSKTEESLDVNNKDSKVEGSTATAADGYDFVDWTDASGSEVSTDPAFAPSKDSLTNDSYSYTANFNKKATKEVKEITISYTAGEGGKVDPSSQKIDLNDESAKVEGSTATADEGYDFVNWTNADGKEVSTDKTFAPDKGDLNADVTYMANFEKAAKEEKNVTVTYKAGEGGKVSVETETVDLNKEDAAFKGATATADDGYQFVKWTGAEDATVSEEAAFVPAVKDVTADVTYTAVFEKKENKAVITYKSTNGGNVYPSTETINLDDKDAVAKGSKATLVSKLFEFVNWTDEDGKEVSTDLTFVPEKVTGDATYTANFKNLVEMPKQVFKGSANGLNVSVVAEENTFPANTTMVVTGVSDEEAIAAAEKTTDDDVADAKGVDITFYDADGNKIEPANNNSVTVTMTSDEAIDGDSHSIVHVDGGSAEKIADAEASGAIFKTDSFSIYVITGTATGSTQTKNNYTVLAGETIHLVCDNPSSNGKFVIADSNKNDAQLLNSGNNSTDVRVNSDVLKNTKITVNYKNNKNKVTASFIITVTDVVTVTFNQNGGNAAAPASETQKTGYKITLPAYSGTKNGYKFSGWSLNGAANNAGEYSYDHAATVYRAGETYEAKSNVTLYAVWSQVNKDAQFFIRLDGTIPTEPQHHSSSEYTAGISIGGVIKEATFYTNGTAGVADHLNSVPSDDQISRVYPKYNKDTQYVLWYVIKSEGMWHVDGVMLSKAKVNLTYDANAPAGSWTAGTMPDGQQYVKGATATVSSQIPIRTGYAFTGWNTKADGTGTRYVGNSNFVINENTTLYAQWVNNAEIVITANSKEKIYDGTALTDGGYSYTGTLETGDTITAVVTGSQTAVGYSQNVVKSYVIKDSKGKDVTAKYGNVTKMPGTLTVSPIQITIKADSASKTYDGKPLTKNSYTKTAGTLMTGDVIISVTVTGSQTDAGTSDNTASAAVIKHDGTDVTGNYTITYEKGSLEVTKAGLTITADSDSKVYDGKPLTKNSYTSTKLAEGDNIAAVTITGSQTFAGTGNNVASAAVIKHDGKDVTGNYDITYVNGTLTVTSANIAITIKADSDSKTYDGKPLTKNSYTMTEGTLIAGDAITSVTVTGSQTDAGTSDNTASAAVIKHDGTDVTGNYTITYEKGSLEVTKAGLTITADSDSKVYDGKPLTKNSYTSTKLAEGDNIAAVTITGSQTFAGTGNNVASAAVIKHDGKDVTGNYDITYVNGTLTVTSANIAITIKADSDSKTYDGKPLTKNSYTMTEGTLIAGDAITSVTVTGSQTDAGTSDNTASAAVIKHDGTDVTGNYTITYEKGSLEVTKAGLTITADSDSKVYDGKPLTKNSYTSTKLAEGDNIAAVTITGSQTFAGTGNNVASAAVIKHDGKDVTGNYDITYVNGTLTVTPANIAITIKADSDSKTYDGKPLTKNSYTMTEGTLIAGDAITSVTVTGSQTDAGTSDNTASAAVIKHDGTDVTGNYTITYEKGSLEVTKAGLTITADSDSKVYDGKPLTKNSYTSTKLAEGDNIAAVTITGSQTFAGTGNNVASAAVIKHDGKDVTGNYDITYVNGTLTVTPANIAITIKADSDSKTYDGKPLTKNSYTMTEGTLIAGDAITSVTVTGSQTDAGTSDNTASAAVIKHDGTDVTGNYTITYEKGSLEVTKAGLTITADSDSKVYDGKPLTKNSYTSTKLAEGDNIAAVTITGSQTFAGTGNNVASAAVIKHDGKDVTGNYDITYVNGTLTVTPANIAITIKADSDSKTYDGKPLTKNSYTMTEGTLIAGDAITSVTVTGSQTDAGTSDNTASAAVIKHDGTDVTENYKITYAGGTLTVDPVAIELTADSATKPYDGKALTADGYEITKGAFVGSSDGLASVTVSGSQLFVGSSANAIKGHTLKDGTKAENYKITYVDGTLTITKASIAIIITANSNEKTYDGTALTDSGYTYTGTLATGDTISSVTVDGSQTDAGNSKNVASGAKIVHTNADASAKRSGLFALIGVPEAAAKSSDPMDVTENYAITYVDGTLTVNRAPLTVTTESASRVYNGFTLTAGGNITGFVNNETATFSVTGAQTETGSSTNTYSLVWDGTAQKTNYIIIENLGTLTVLYPGDQGGDTTPVVTPVKPTTPVGQVLGATRLPDVPAPAAPAPAKDGSVLGAMRNVVQTGDSSMMVTWGAIFAAAVAVLAVWLRKRNKKA